VAKADGRTEKATPRRKREARRDGQLAKSVELSTALSLLAALIAIKAFVPMMLRSTIEGSREIWVNAGDGISRDALAGNASKMFLIGAAPFLGTALVIGVLGGFAQTGFAFATKAAKPKLSNLSLKRGLDRLKPGQAGWQLVKEAFKLGVFFLAVKGPITSWIDGFSTTKSLSEWVTGTSTMVWSALIRAVALGFVIGAADYFVSKRRLVKQLRMSKQELKEEHKSYEGNPQMKAQRRHRAQELSRNRMMSEVGNADVVITNPTHYAVALKYVDGEPAPRVVAKGANHMALKIRKLAYRHGVLVQQDPPLARAIYHRCKVGQFIPSALYEAVAVVIATAYRRRIRGIA
jgi:flagellar biosynthesis protein FlhB